MIMRKTISVMMFLVVIMTLTGYVEGKAQYGEAIPGNVKVVHLKEILAHPDKYKDKEVALEGNYGNYCCASDFVYKEGIDAVEVYPQRFPTPKLKRGKPIRVYGIVRSVKKGAGLKEGEGEKDVREIYIEAKGVEIR